jgi:F-type H+-transporting ATPase subunit b
MENRTKKIEDVINQAEKDKNQAKQMLEQYETQLKNAETEADGIIRLARETANAESDRIIDNGKRAAQTMLSGARRQFAAEQEAALAQFKSEAVMLVMAASARLVGRDLQSEENNRYVNMLMDELSAHCAGAAWVKQKED